MRITPLQFDSLLWKICEHMPFVDDLALQLVMFHSYLQLPRAFPDAFNWKIIALNG